MELSIVIPSKNEKYIAQTILDITKNKRGDTEIIWEEDPGLGQRALTNKLVDKSKAKYVMKVDAHCSFSPGFDVKMMKDMDDQTIMAPYLFPLDAENWVIQHFPKMSNYAFDTDLVMQHVPNPSKELITETMCLQGSAWMVDRQTYWDWDLCGEDLGSWGMQGSELGIKAYLNGGRCVTNGNAFYGHLFRTNEIDFPYKRDKADIEKTKDLFVKKFKNKSIAGLIEKFNYPCNWTEEIVDDLK